MSVGYYHRLCQQYRGRTVQIKTRDGRLHRGMIERVGANHVFVRPLGGRSLGGFGYGPWGFGGYGGFDGFGGGYGYRIALGAIAAIALIPLFFW